MGSTLHVRLCPHKVWREKYGCAKCDAEERLAAPFEQRVTPVARVVLLLRPSQSDARGTR